MGNTTFFNGGIGDNNRKRRGLVKGNTTFFNGGVGDESTDIGHENMGDIMYKKINYPKYGDVVCVDRSMFGFGYEHYAVYIGNGKVIEYSKPRKKKKASISPWAAVFTIPVETEDNRASIIESDFEDFLEGFSSYKVCYFPDVYGRPTKEMMNAFTIAGVACGFCGISNIYRFFTDTKEKYHVYSPEETVQRAKSRLGEKDYFLLTNNCEYFALWCKTGVHESHQVQDFIKCIEGGFLEVGTYSPA